MTTKSIRMKTPLSGETKVTNGNLEAESIQRGEYEGN